MYFLRRITPIFLTAFTLAVLTTIGFDTFLRSWFLSISDKSINYVIGLLLVGILAIIIAILFIGVNQPLKSRLRFTFFPIALFSSAFGVLLFSDQFSVLITIVVVCELLLWVWLENLYVFWLQSNYYQVYTLERLAGYFYLIELFLCSVALAGGRILLSLPFWLIALVFFAVHFSTQWDFYLLKKLDSGKSFIISLLGSFLALQLFLAGLLLPTHLLFVGISQALFLYVWLGFTHQAILRKEQFEYKLTYLIIGCAGFFFSFASTLFIR